MITFAEWTELTGLPEARALEERYGTDDTRLPGFTTGASEPPERRWLTAKKRSEIKRRQDRDGT
jgi:hypothetical protein